MHEYEIAVLKFLKEKNKSDLETLEEKLNINKDSIIWALENLSKINAVKINRQTSYTPIVTEEGFSYLKSFPEEELVKQINKAGKKEKLENIKDEIGLIWAKKNKWIEIEGDYAKLTSTGIDFSLGKFEYPDRAVLNSLRGSDTNKIQEVLEKNKETIKNLTKRGLLDVKERSFITEIEIAPKGAELKDLDLDTGIGQVTRSVIVNKNWANKKFRKYDINANAEPVYPARLHPMHEFIEYIRDVWFGMGFVEVSGPMIESAFWNFDALFAPQDHPTRDMQDTFFLSNPREINIEDIELLNRVKKMHRGSWKEEWKEELAKQALLRTHTTSVSAHYISKFANALEASYPLKLFSIGKIFRNESIDYKHLAELYQCDGIVIGNNLTLSNLIDILKRFYTQLGMENIKIKPSYFPFVEPGLEIYYYDDERKDTIELCGAGIIRREITRAMGTNKTVLAWGMGLERPIMRFIKIGALTELYKNNVNWLRNRAELI